MEQERTLEKLTLLFRKTPDGIGVLTPKGELTFLNVDEVRTYFNELMGEGFIRLLLNLSHLEHIDSMGVGFFIEEKNIAEEKGGDIQIWGAMEDIEDIFEVVGIKSLFGMYRTEGEGLQGMRGE